MRSIKSRIEKGVLKNDVFKKVLCKNKYLQVALLKLNAGSVVQLKTHDSMDQFVGFAGEEGKCIVEGREYNVESGDVIEIPASSRSDAAEIKCHKKAQSGDKFFSSYKQEGFTQMTQSDLENDF